MHRRHFALACLAAFAATAAPPVHAQRRERPGFFRRILRSHGVLLLLAAGAVGVILWLREPRDGDAGRKPPWERDR